ncbi:hypothetical protein SLS56_010150 [Neofusicoccum ribis]|uniref:F-box domain-containing protein n=1 Tax=Neofusicoccum ribis TaxID=45134 RepID=A0ABR3SF94_9PEZI
MLLQRSTKAPGLSAAHKKRTGLMDLPTEIRQRIFSKVVGFCNLRRETAQLIFSLPEEPFRRHEAVRRLKQVENTVASDPKKAEISKADARKYTAFRRLSCVNRVIRMEMTYVEMNWLTKDLPIDIFELPYWKPTHGQTVVTIAIKPYDARVRHFNSINNEVVRFKCMSDDSELPERSEIASPYYTPDYSGSDECLIHKVVQRHVPKSITCIQLTSITWNGVTCTCLGKQLCTKGPHPGAGLSTENQSVRSVERMDFIFSISRKKTELVAFKNDEALYDRYCMESLSYLQTAEFSAWFMKTQHGEGESVST